MPELPRNIRSERLTEIGSGEYKKVFEDPHNPNNVLKIHDETGFDNSDKESIRLVLGMEFYLTKILHLLEPELIPDIHMASVTTIPQTIHDRVSLLQTKTEYEKYEEPNDPAILSPRERKEIRNRFYNYGISIDQNPYNFRKTENGKPVYVDSPYKGYPEQIIHLDDQKTRNAIQLLPKEKRVEALRYLDRFIELREIFNTHKLHIEDNKQRHIKKRRGKNKPGDEETNY